MSVWVDRLDGQGNLLGRELMERGSLRGDLIGGVQALGHELGVDPYRLRQAIGAGRVAASFEGSGRYRVAAAEVERVRVDGLGPPSGQLSSDEGEPAATLSPRSGSLVDAMFGAGVR
jgi:hypothetical protein